MTTTLSTLIATLSDPATDRFSTCLVIADAHEDAGNDDAARAYRCSAEMVAAEDAYRAARGKWVRADWSHEYHLGGEVQMVDDDNPVYCQGQMEDCSYCEEGLRDAEIAEDEARVAVEYLREGDVDEAWRRANEASSKERRYGDDPTWGPLLTAIEALRSAMDAAATDEWRAQS